jgi:hypothetical protein
MGGTAWVASSVALRAPCDATFALPKTIEIITVKIIQGLNSFGQVDCQCCDLK